MYLTIRLVMMTVQNREKFRVARLRTPPPTEDGGLPLALSLRQEGTEKIARELDCHCAWTKLKRHCVDLV
jgi:hypothetical protein